MSIWETFFLSIGVSLDAFAIALAVSLQPQLSTWSQRINLIHVMWLSAFFSLYLAVAVGQFVVGNGGIVPTWLVPMILAGIGFYSIVKSNDNPQEIPTFSGSWLSLLVLGLLASFDVGTVGVAIGFEQSSTWIALILIPLATAISTLLGIVMSGPISQWLGDSASCLGGSILMLTASGMCW